MERNASRSSCSGLVLLMLHFCLDRFRLALAKKGRNRYILIARDAGATAEYERTCRDQELYVLQ